MIETKKTGSAKGYAMKECDKCHTKTRRPRKYKGKFYCHNCYRSEVSFIGSSNTNKKISLQKALDKIYHIKGRYNSQGNLQCILSLPSVLAGKKIKLVLCEDE